jgi:hypothetical protein
MDFPLFARARQSARARENKSGAPRTARRRCCTLPSLEKTKNPPPSAKPTT